jgi:hypothetical protein
VAYDTVASAIAPYADAAASQVAQRLDTDVLALLRHATGNRQPHPPELPRQARPPDEHRHCP